MVVFSTACVYPFAQVTSKGADEAVPTLPPPGDYATSCVGREKAFEYGSLTHGTPVRLLRLDTDDSVAAAAVLQEENEEDKK